VLCRSSAWWTEEDMMDLQDIRRVIITALCSDDLLLDILVLKGGNALNLVHGIGYRSSLDIDFSMAGDFDDLDAVRARLFRALEDRFDSHGLVAYEVKLEPKPRRGARNPRWGGYRLEFKLIEKERFEELKGNIEDVRHYSLTIDGSPQSSRIFSVDISKFEFCEGKVERELDGYTVYVYTPTMIAAEKIRAICQQMPECEPKAKQEPRARDFYDIHEIVETEGLDFAREENRDLVRRMFEAKEVPLALLAKIRDTKEAHAHDQPAVELALGTNAEGDFEFYFDSVVRMVEEKLKPLWEE
jgi:hypothetical protein